MSEINDLKLRDEPIDEIPQDLPEQRSSFGPTLPPGIWQLQLPADLRSLWAAMDVEDQEHGVRQYVQLKVDRDHPAVITAGPDATRVGEPYTFTVSTMPRPRGRGKGTDRTRVSDMSYLLRLSLQSKANPKSNKEYIQEINKYAGKVVVIRSGLQGQCRTDRVIWITMEDGTTVEDPNGQMGCGQRHYTDHFKASNGTYSERIFCKKCGNETGATVRGFSQIDEFLAPVGVKK